MAALSWITCHVTKFKSIHCNPIEVFWDMGEQEIHINGCAVTVWCYPAIIEQNLWGMLNPCQKELKHFWAWKSVPNKVSGECSVWLCNLFFLNFGMLWHLGNTLLSECKMRLLIWPPFFFHSKMKKGPLATAWQETFLAHNFLYKLSIFPFVI